MITTNETICWRIVQPNGRDYDEGDGIRHYGDEADARDQATDIGEARPFPNPCVALSCDGCEADLDNEAFDQMHFVNDADAHNVAEKSDWTITSDGRAYCWDCKPPKEEIS